MEKNLQKYVKSTLLSVGIGIISMFLTLIIFSLIIAKLDSSTMLVDLCTMLIAAICGMTCGYVHGKIVKRNGIFIGLLSGAVMVFVIVIFKLAFFDSAFTGASLIKFALIIVFSIVGSILGVNKKTKNKYAKLKKARA